MLQEETIALQSSMRTAAIVVMAIALGAIACMIASRRPRLVTIARWILGVILGQYGVAKLTGSFHRLETSARLADLKSDELFWYVFGYSRPFVVFLGLVEIAAALLLLATRTRRIGALLWIALGTHIAVLDLSYGVGALALWMSGLTLACVGLVAVDLPAYRRALAALTEKPPA